MRPSPIELPERLPDLPAKAFARGAGQTFTASANVIELYDEIGGLGITAKDLRAALKDAPGDVTLRVNSPGGSVFEGLAIYNDLVAHPGNVAVEITGIAASIASLVAMAADSVSMAPNAFMMIHNSHAIALGDARTHDDAANVLRKIDGQMAATYASRTGANLANVRGWMNRETWFNAAEAKAAGFADDIADGAESPRAKFDLSIFAKAPQELRAEFASIDPNNPRDLERALREAGVSRSRARAIVSHGYRSAEHRDDDDASAIELAAHIAAITKRFEELH